MIFNKPLFKSFQIFDISILINSIINLLMVVQFDQCCNGRLDCHSDERYSI